MSVHDGKDNALSDTEQFAPEAVDRPQAVAAASYLTMLSLTISNIQPVVLGAIAIDYGFGDAKLGQMGSTFVAFLTLASLTAPAWVRRVHWQRFSFVAILLFTGALVAGTQVSSVIGLIALFAVLGVLSAVVGAPGFASLGDTKTPDRNYGVSSIVQAIAAAIIVAPLMGYVVPNFGVHGLMISLALLMASGLAACKWLPDTGKVADFLDDAPHSGSIFVARAVPAFLVLFAIGCFGAGLGGFWFYVERIGVWDGASPQAIGVTLSACSLVTILSSGIVVWLGGRISTLVFILLGSLAMLACFQLVLMRSTDGFIAGNIFFSFGFGLAQPCYWGLLRKVDATNRLFVAATAASGAATVIAGLVAGPIIAAGGYPGLMAACSLIVAAGFAIAVLAARLARSSPETLASPA